MTLDERNQIIDTLKALKTYHSVNEDYAIGEGQHQFHNKANYALDVAIDTLIMLNGLEKEAEQ